MTKSALKILAILSSAVIIIAILFNIKTPHKDDSRTDYQPPVSAYRSGDINSATRLLSEIATGPADLTSKIEARLLLANICDEINDAPCATQNNEGLSTLLTQAPEGPQKSAVLLAAAPSLLKQQLWSGQVSPENADQLFSKLNQEDFFAFRPEKYLLLQTAQIELAFLYGDHQAARRAVSRLIASAVALPESHAYLLPSYLVEIVLGLQIAGDNYGALVYFNKFDEYLSNSLPETSATRLKYLRLTAELARNAGTPALLDGAVERLDTARSLLDKMQLPQSVKEREAVFIALAKTQTLTFSDRLAEAAASLPENPVFSRKKAVQSAGQFVDLSELHFALTDVYLSHASGKPMDKGWEKALSTPAIWEGMDALGVRFESQRKLGLALLLRGKSPLLAQRLLNDAASKQIALFETSLFSLDRRFPLPDFFEQILLGLTLDGLSQKTSLSPAERDIAMKSMSILQRNIMHSRGDLLYLTSLYSSERTKGHAQSLLLLGDRRADLEIRGLQQRIDASLEAQSSPQNMEANRSKALETRKQLAAMGLKINTLSSRMPMPPQTALSLPGSRQIAALLHSEEAMLAHTAFAGTIYKTCLTAQNQLSLVKETPEQSLIVDRKIIMSTLTASHAPSPELDSQYPAQAAMRLHKVILGNMETCLAGKSRILYSPSMDFAPLPLAVLLDRLPPKMGDGYDLSKAAWVIRRYDIANISSFTEFLAARQIARRPGVEFSFLGVGDPVLAPGTSSEAQLLALRNGKTISHNIASLAELPATSVELKNIAAQYENPTLLLRENASKRRFLSEPLGHFNVMEFATHGLITGELSTITEPGLVLSPSLAPASGARDNGFLSSTEIAALRLKARLVVLSACNTAKFDTDNFAGSIRSLTNSFASAGIPATIASLWPVESDTSQKLMSALFTKFKDGRQTASSSLAFSMREFLDQPTSPAHLHPRFWAPFVTYGDGGVTGRSPVGISGQGFTLFDTDERPGEIMSLAQADGLEGEYFVSRLGDWDGKRFSSFVERRNTEGKTIWAMQDKRIGAGQIVASKDRIFVEGYVSPSNASATSVLRSFDLDGRLLWSRDLPGKEPLSFVSSLALSSSGKLWAVIYSGSAAARKSTLRIVLLTQDGEVEKEWALEIGNEIGGSHPSLLVPGDQDDAHLLTYIPSAPSGITKDDFGERRVCRGNDGTQIFKLDGGSAVPKQLSEQAGVQILKAKRIDGVLYASGVKRAYCGSEGEPYFARLRPDHSLQEIYVERGFEGGRFGDFIQKDGKIILSGQVGSHIKEYTAGPISFDPLTGMVDVDFNRIDSFLVELDPANPGPQPRLQFIDAGADIAIAGLDEEDGALTLAGSIGAQPFWGRYRLQ